MQIVRDSIYELWKNLVNAAKEEDIGEYASKNDLNDKQIDYIEKKIWDFMTDCALPEKLPDRQGRAFWIAWGNCKINHQDIAERLTKQLIEEGKQKAHLSENNIKGYLIEVRKKIRERVRNESAHWDWIKILKRYENES